jgi:hypothetical protein
VFVVLSLLVVLWSGSGFVSQRTLLLLPATLLPLFGLGLSWLAANRPRAAVVAVALLALDLGVGSLWSPYRADLEDFGRSLAEETAHQGSGRTVLLSCAVWGCEAGEWQVGYESPLRTLTGGFREAAPDTYEYLNGLVQRIAKDPRVVDNELAVEASLVGVASVRVLTTRKVMPRDPDFAGIIRGVPVTYPDEVSADRSEGPRRIIRFAPIWGQSNKDFLPSWHRVAVAWVPGLRATLDEREANLAEDPKGFVLVWIEKKGETTLVIEYPTSTRFLWGPIVAAMLTGGLAWRGRRRRT